MTAQKNTAIGLDSVRDFSTLGSEQKERLFRSMWQEYRVRPGMCVSVFDAQLQEDFTFCYRKENRFMDFGFFLEGAFANDLRKTPIGRLNLENRAGEGGMGFFREIEGTVTIPAGKKTRLIHVHVLPDVLRSLLEQDMETVHPELRGALEPREGNDFYRRRCLQPMVQAVANELFFGVRNNFGVRMYMEGKVLELLGLFLAEGGNPAADKKAALSPRERDVIHAIRAELEERYASPPTLAEIAARHHMGVSKVQAGFRAVFGMSVFNFLKEYKLQKAKMLFDEGDMNVSEVAWTIGYINLSHFGAAFRKRFGVLPKAYHKSIRARAHGVGHGRA
ncbi:helix-turn-helix domain-containing protein [Salidesulfovibrio onnuriiensis]|uniref:helix-turn-helix domain-containing protein n=1 Tax=Salidesulfovibrio onnuriiensis TaxID=2583823 RepID=UPI0011C9A4EF|nr:AraC family transcriptional regulator [Salidesulfovibrio onnuriiensis]